MELEPIPAEAADAIERTRRLTVKLGGEVTARGVEPVDSVLGVAYGLHDLALQLHGNPVAAIEWLRTTIDLFERGHLTGGITVVRKGGDAG